MPLGYPDPTDDEEYLRSLDEQDPAPAPPPDVAVPAAPSPPEASGLLGRVGLPPDWLAQKKAALGKAYASDKAEQARANRDAELMQFAQSFVNRKFTPIAARNVTDARSRFAAETGLENHQQGVDLATLRILAGRKGPNLADQPAPTEWGARQGMTRGEAIRAGYAKPDQATDTLEPELVDRAKRSGVPTAGRKREPVIADILAAEKAAADRGTARDKEDRGAKGDTLKTEQELRREFIGQKGYQDYQTISAAAEKVKTATASGAGDISLVYGFMKLTDPGSTVREGEFATAASAGSTDQKVVAWYNKALTGERLPPEVRDQFKREADVLLAAQRKRYQRLAEQYRGLAKRYGVDPDRVVFEPGSDAASGAIGSKDPMGVR